MYDAGQGVPRDYKAAVKWYTLAAEQGDAMAQLNLGVNYVTGKGVPQDYVRAHLWWSLSASTGNETAIKHKDRVAGMMTPSQLEEAQDIARECVGKNYKGC